MKGILVGLAIALPMYGILAIILMSAHAQGWF